MSSSRSVYISYSWGAEKRHPLVDELLAALKAKGIEVKRDRNEINPYDSIRAYMDDLAEGRAIILVLSEEYFKSPNCMYELREIYLNNRKEFRKRIFPVVLEGTKFHRAADRIRYIKFWVEETATLNAKLSSVSREDLSAVSHNELRDYADFRRMIDDLLALISDMCSPTQEEHLKTGFSALIERMFSQPAPDGGGGTDKTGNAANISQHTIGNGNVSSGSGNVTVNNINIHADGTAPQPEKTDSPVSPAKLGPIFNVPDTPPNYFARPDDLKEFRAALLAEGTQAVGITGKRQHVGVQGMGGLGKSVLAAALAHDEDVRAAFPDGIFWLRFRQDIDDAYLLEQQAEILKILAPDQLPDTLAYGENLLNLALQDKRCLFIADDLWDSKYLRHFNVKSSGCRFLLTTRNAEVIKKTGAHKCELGLLSDTQAREFLALSSGCAENDLPDEAAAILRECGRLPLAVAAIGSMVKGKPAQRWQTALEKLQNARLDKIPANLTDDYNYKSLFRVFEVSVEDLPPEVQAYYKTLVIFPEDAKIPESVLQLYWEHCPQGDYEPLDAVDLLVERSLLSRGAGEFVTLHDLLRDYLTHQSGGDVASLHKQLLEAYKAEYPGGWHTIPYEKHFYFYKYWQFHLQAAGEIAQAPVIADALIRQQPWLNLIRLQTALRFADYKFSDIAAYLLKENKHPDVLIACLNILGDEAKESAKRFLQESNQPTILTSCIKILGDEAKEDAKRLLKEHQNPALITACFAILETEAREEMWHFLKESNQPDILIDCLKILGNDAKDDAKRLLKENNQPNILIACMKILGSDAKDDAKYLLKTSNDPHLLNVCLKLLNQEAKEDARRLLDERKSDDVVATCLKILGKEAKDDAKYFLKESKLPNILSSCLNILGHEAKKEARFFLKNHNHPYILAVCLKILGEEAKEDARKLLRSSKSEWLLLSCIRILGKEAEDVAIRLAQTGRNKFVRQACCKYALDIAPDNAKLLALQECFSKSRFTGTVKFIRPSCQRNQLYGYIEMDDGSTDVRFNSDYVDITGLEKGTRVAVEVNRDIWGNKVALNLNRLAEQHLAEFDNE
uniref:NB-ARC domain-containing protein n=1 Tax=Candidatus Electronema sp. TaxID=2698783 RepID=UPI0040562F3F